MKVSILLFSPAGTTREVGNILRESIVEKGFTTQLVDITGNADFFRRADKRRFFEETMEKHDFLCIGGPVYAHRMQFTILDAIRCLPEPGSGFAKPTAIFATYGGITSGCALYETARLLERSGRIPVLAMKINAFHSVSREFSTSINPGLPGAEEEAVIRDMAERICGFLDGKYKAQSVTERLNYQSPGNRFKDGFFSEGGLIGMLMPPVTPHPERCERCGVCAKKCPVQRIAVAGTGVKIDERIKCIHCSNCQVFCPAQAITHSMSGYEKALLKAAQGKGMLPSNEFPRSAVYA